MANKTYIGVSNVARNVTGAYVGVNNVARTIIKAYIGDANGKAKLCFANGMQMSTGSIAFSVGSTVTVNTGFKPKYLMVWSYYTEDASSEDFFTTILYTDGWNQKALCMNQNYPYLGLEYRLSNGSDIVTLTNTGFKITYSEYRFFAPNKVNGYIAFG